MIGYACKYTPIELIRALGGIPVLLGEPSDSFEAAESLSHSNLCSYSKAFIENFIRSGMKELFLVNCCDSIRLAYDVLIDEGSAKFAFLMDLPNSGSGCAKKQLQSELLRFFHEYTKYKNSAFDIEEFANAFEEPVMLPEGEFVAVMGARSYDSLISELSARLAHPLYDMTCRKMRQVSAESCLSENGFDSASYAAALLSQYPCMRMNQSRNVKDSLLLPKLAGIVYHTIAFCDFYSFEYEQLRKKTKLPVLKLESDYISGNNGQLSTRIDAFAESLRADCRVIRASMGAGKLVAGIDSGSTTTKIVVMDRSGEICAQTLIRTGAKALLGAQRAFEAVMKELGVSRAEFAYITATGYGRSNIPFADEAVTEISCHAKGAHRINPAAETIIDIGGQDSKVIRLSNNGSVMNFVMNDKCAAGTGRFLEMMASTLELGINEMGEKGLDWKHDLTISSVCTVFAESEIISLIADNHSLSDIIHGLNKAIATKTASLARRLGDNRAYMMTGGVARNKGVVKELESKLGLPIMVPDAPDICGAVGAALYAYESAFGVSGDR